MDPKIPPASLEPDGPPRRRRPRHIWSFERLEDRTLLATGPVVATPAELSGARPITASASGLIAPGESDFFRLDAATDELLIAQAHADGAHTRLSLLDAQGNLLTQSDGLSVANPDDLIAQHISQGTYYLELTGTGGIGSFTLTIQALSSSTPGSAIMLSTKASITAVVTGDFNGDGRADLAEGFENYDPAVGAFVGGGVSVLLGDGDGTFRSTVTYATAGPVTSLAVGDFNGDGRADLAAGFEDYDPTTGISTGGVSVLLNAGGGAFRSPADYATAGPVTSLAVGDFNGDGRADLAAGFGNLDPTTGISTGGVSVLLNAGGGAFRSPADYATAGPVTSLAVGDFNGDGNLDLAAGLQNYDPTVGTFVGGVSVLLGGGGGTFRSPVDYAAGRFATSLAVGDFNGDGNLDLAAGGSGSVGVSVLLGDGGGTFRSPVTYATVGSFTSLAVGDFNGDGRADLAAGDGFGGVSVLLGDGGGTFRSPVTYATGGSVGSLAVGDFNGDGRADLAARHQNLDFTTGISTGGVSVLLGGGDGTLRSPVDYTTGGPVTSLAVGDFNGDGNLDLAAGTFRGLFVLLGAGDGTFGSPVTYATAGPAALAVGDFNGDGRADLAAGTDGGVSVLLGDGDGTFRSPVTYATAGPVTSLAVGDFNGDGRADLAAGFEDYDPTTGTSTGGVSVLLNAGGGAFRSPVTYATAGPVTSLAVGDFNGDGRADLAAGFGNLDPTTGTSTGGVSVLLNAGGGAFRSPVTYATAGPVTSLAVGDFNGDGRADLAAGFGNLDPTTGISTGGVSVLLNAGGGAFRSPADYATAGPVGSLAVGDFNGDGRADLAAGYQNLDPTTGNFVGDVVSVLLGDGGGTFRSTVPYAVMDAVMVAGNFALTLPLAVGDFNGDGRADLGFLEHFTGRPSVLLDTGSNMLSNSNSSSTPIRDNPLLADLGGIGTPDLTVIDQSGDILWRKGIPGRSGTYEPPVVVNPGTPSRDIAIVSSGGRNLIASVDSVDDAIVLYAFRNGGFVEVGRLSTGSLPSQIITARLTGNGLEDLVVRNAGDGTASIYLADGLGGFTRMIPDRPIGVGASDITAADLDGSGRDGLVVTNQATGDVRVLPSLGDGTFGPPSRYQAGSGPYGLTTNADGSNDLASQEATTGVAVGTFAPGSTAGLAVINPGSYTLAILDGLGGGALANARVLPTVAPGSIVRAADLRGDGITDLLVLTATGLDVYLGDGRGGFSATPAHYDVGPDPTGLTVADLDGDGRLDVLIGNKYGDVLVLLDNGDGTFRPFLNADKGIALAVADLNGDGQADVIYADQGLDRVTVQYPFVGPVAPGGPATVQHVVGDRSQGLLAPGAVTSADFTIGGVTSRYLIVANSGSNDVLVYPGLGNGQFGPALNGGQGFFTGENPVSVTVAYLVTTGPGAGLPDLVVADKGSNDVAILLGQMQNGSLTFVPGPRLKAGAGPVSAVVETLPGDLHPDLLVSDSQANQVRILRGRGEGFFNDNPPPSDVIPVGTDPGPLFVGDFTGRPGELDLVTVNPGSDSLSLVPNFLEGGVAQSIASGGSEPVAAIAFQDNGVEGLLVANEGDGTLALFLGGTGGLAEAGRMDNPDVPNPTALAFDALSGNVLQFYAGTAGVEAATLLQFNLGGEGGNGGGISSPSPTPSPAQPVLSLQPLGQSSLAIIATLLTELTSGESPSAAAVETTAAVVSQGNAGALPNQPASRAGQEPLTDDEAAPDDAEDALGPALPAEERLSPLRRFLYRLDEAIEKARRDAREATSGSSRPMGGARAIGPGPGRGPIPVVARPGGNGRPDAGPPGGPRPGRSRHGPRDRLDAPAGALGREGQSQPARLTTPLDSNWAAPAITSISTISLVGVAKTLGVPARRRHSLPGMAR